MKRFLARRLLQGVVLLCLVATIVFFLGRLTGNPVDLMLPEDATAEDRAALIGRIGTELEKSSAELATAWTQQIGALATAAPYMVGGALFIVKYYAGLNAKSLLVEPAKPTDGRGAAARSGAMACSTWCWSMPHAAAQGLGGARPS